MERAVNPDYVAFKLEEKVWNRRGRDWKREYEEDFKPWVERNRDRYNAYHREYKKRMKERRVMGLDGGE